MMENIISEFNQFQKQIYINGFFGEKPLINPDWQKLEMQALAKMSKEAAAYIGGGAGLQQSMKNNRNGFDALKIVPKMLAGGDQRNTSVKIFDVNFPSPFWLCPIGVSEMVHNQADIAIAKAATNTNIPMVFSNQASVAMETCAESMGESPRFFQLYWSKSRDLIQSFVERAEKSGCKGIVLTLDTTLLGWRTKDLELAYLPFLLGKGIAQYTSDPIFQKLLNQELAQNNKAGLKPKMTFSTIKNLVSTVNLHPEKGNFISKLKSGRAMASVKLFTDIYSNPALNWNDLPFLRSITKLPIILKGILNPDDALKAIDFGMDGIVVSNHGGRQVDGSISSIEALPAISKAVNKRIPIILDSGIRGGADVFKALALGASAVGLGRPFIYGLAINGQEGVEEVIRQLQADFELTMVLSGCKNVGEINRDFVIG